MKTIIKILSLLGLLMTLLPSFFVFKEVITADQCKILMFIGTVVWFVTAPRWMNKKEEETPA
ncbi:hypothetical protein QWY93_08925 [Echinicola jeungdonensis]|uniref:TMhelix containing protein n=1 Tax=Echinicola jeungdonensis TaxID=709343 RepID=A0ABV5J8F7_9BACT|nr:hypothetical protein [Echinicola jeungdonensis]MDN3669452.1 hypothetical protein [Echinicola jeungdonensis]